MELHIIEVVRADTIRPGDRIVHEGDVFTIREVTFTDTTDEPAVRFASHREAGIPPSGRRVVTNLTAGDMVYRLVGSEAAAAIMEHVSVDLARIDAVRILVDGELIDVAPRTKRALDNVAADLVGLDLDPPPHLAEGVTP